MKMSKKIVNINIKPVIYDRDTNGDIVIDINGQAVVLTPYDQVLPTDNYDYKVEITEYP